MAKGRFLQLSFSKLCLIHLKTLGEARVIRGFPFLKGLENEDANDGWRFFVDARTTLGWGPVDG